jgi:hypothetical protein
MNASEFIFELKKTGNCKNKEWDFINILKKDRQLIKKILEKIDKKLLENGLTKKEISLIL